MSFKLDDQTAQAFTNLRASADFWQVLKWLKGYETKELDHCVNYEGQDLHQAQGAVKCLRRIEEAYEESPELLEKLKSKK